MKSLPKIVVAVFLAITWTLGVAQAQDLKIEDFFGTYEGESITGNGKMGLEKRDLSVTIKPWKKKKLTGFTVSWTTIRRRADGREVKKTYKIDFRDTGREGIYGSAMKVNYFGKAKPLDPLKGDPYVWARIQGQTLTVYAMHIIHDGSYEMQVYHRTLTEKGMDLLFTRWHEGEPVREIRGTLVRESG